MGYTTDFKGQFNLDRPLKPEHKAYLEKFSETRRMKRNGKRTCARPDPIRDVAGLLLGVQGGHFVGGEGPYGQEVDAKDVVDYNNPPEGQPGLWCQWVPNEDGTAIEWNGGEKFYEYVGWLTYLIHHFLAPWEYTLNGEVSWKGEDADDLGKIIVKNNEVQIKTGHIVYD